MIENTKHIKPLWVKLLFEAPEFIYESLLKGIFPELRKNVIDTSTRILIYCDQKGGKLPNLLQWVESKTLTIIEWINNNWKKNSIINKNVS